jgi:NAD(P)H-dependent FMN reductase
MTNAQKQDSIYMKIGIIIGSMQAESNSAKIARYLSEQLTNSGPEPYILDLYQNALPMWDNSIWEGNEEWNERLNPVNEELKSCDGFIIICPEYHGMAPAALKNFFLCFGKDSLAHKPGYLVGVSSGIGGTYPIAELRMSSTKNNRLCFTPEHCIVRYADNVLNANGENDEVSDPLTRDRLNYGLAILIEYAKAMRSIRESSVVDHQSFSNGM